MVDIGHGSAIIMKLTQRRTQMQITVSDKLIRSAVRDLLEIQLFTLATPQQRRDAGVPSKDKLVDELMQDPKFMERVAKYLTNYVNDADVISDALDEAPLHPRVKKLARELDRVCED